MPDLSGNCVLPTLAPIVQSPEYYGTEYICPFYKLRESIGNMRFPGGETCENQGVRVYVFSASTGQGTVPAMQELPRK